MSEATRIPIAIRELGTRLSPLVDYWHIVIVMGTGLGARSTLH
jgi:hypothetical protein